MGNVKGEGKKVGLIIRALLYKIVKGLKPSGL